MSQIENHYHEVVHIETEIQRKMIALGLDWHNEQAMKQLASECKVFHEDDAQSAYASHERERITKAELFGLVSLMLSTMENAALEGRVVHGGEIWKAFGIHLYN